MRTGPATSSTDSHQRYLVLRREDGSAWTLRFSEGIECFIGLYPRVDGFDCGGPLIVYREIDAA